MFKVFDSCMNNVLQVGALRPAKCVKNQ